LLPTLNLEDLEEPREAPIVLAGLIFYGDHKSKQGHQAGHEAGCAAANVGHRILGHPEGFWPALAALRAWFSPSSWLRS
jgi:hypothetical protein